MPRATYLQYSFNAGEWSPAVWGRVDLQKRRMAMSYARNIVPLLSGAATRRPGTWMVEPAKTNSADVRLIPFEFSTTQAYVLELGEQYIRFFTNQGQLLNGAAPYEVSTPYLGSELLDIGFTQSADTLYLTHANHPPMKLQRFGATNWTLTEIAFQDGPYLARNISDTYIASSVAWSGGTGTIVANNTHGLNSGAGFQSSTDVDRVFRIGTQTLNTDGTSEIKWSWGNITAVTDTTHADVTMKGITPL